MTEYTNIQSQVNVDPLYKGVIDVNEDDYSLIDFTSLPRKFLKYDEHRIFYETFKSDTRTCSNERTNPKRKTNYLCLYK